jgi:hypothetical protein
LDGSTSARNSRPAADTAIAEASGMVAPSTTPHRDSTVFIACLPRSAVERASQVAVPSAWMDRARLNAPDRARPRSRAENRGRLQYDDPEMGCF